MLSNEMKIIATENRIALLQSRTNRENGKIVNKLKRRLRMLAAAG